MTYLPPACAVLVGYVVGRVRPALRLANWAAWKTCGTRTGLRWRIAWLVIQAEALLWITCHPLQAHDAWRRRNDPPPPRSPAL